MCTVPARTFSSDVRPYMINVSVVLPRRNALACLSHRVAVCASQILRGIYGRGAAGSARRMMSRDPLTRRLDACATVNFVEMIKVQFNHQGSPWGNILPMKAHEIYNLLLSLTFKGPIK